jgi:protein-disulfide isomerase
MDAPDVAAIVQANYRLAQAIGVTGTPAFIIGDQLIPGAVEPARLRSLIEQQRANKS